MSANRWVRILLVLWVVGYLLISCGPAIVGDGVSGTLIGGAIGLILGGVLFVPWAIGVIVLIVLIMLTQPDRERLPPPR